MPEGPQTRSQLLELLERHDIRPTRHLGQHFLADPNLVRKIVELARGEPGDPILEVGAGTGTLTRTLAEAGYRVLALELDQRLRPLLEEALEGVTGVDLRFEDALRAGLPALLDDRLWRMVANLPYNVGTPLVLDLLQGAPQLTRYVIMVQREVADRLSSEPGSRTYGLPSVVVGLHARVERAFRVPPQVFVPPPRVESEVLVLERRSDVPALAGRAIELAARAFRQRRKMLRSSLGEVVEPDTLSSIGISPRARPEELSPDQFLHMAEESRDGG